MITKSPILFTKVLCFQYNIKFFENISGFKDIRTVWEMFTWIKLIYLLYRNEKN